MVPARRACARRPGGLLDELHAHHQVVVEEAPGVVAVGADAADLRRQVDDQVGPRVGQQARDAAAVDEIVVGRARHEDLAPAARSCSTTKQPRKPAPPVTTTRLPAQKSHESGGIYPEVGASRCAARRSRALSTAASRPAAPSRRPPRRPAPSARPATRRRRRPAAHPARPHGRAVGRDDEHAQHLAALGGQRMPVSLDELGDSRGG